jgi:enolase
MDATDQAAVDTALIELDGQVDKGRLGGNTIVATSMAVAHAAAGKEEAVEVLVRAIEGAGLTPGQDVAVSLDIAASEFYRDGLYHLASEDRSLDRDGLCEMLLDWLVRYPIAMIEDPLVESDPETFPWGKSN